MQLALCSETNITEIEKVLQNLGELTVYIGIPPKPPRGPKPSGYQLFCSIIDGKKVDLVVVPIDGALGLNTCNDIRSRHKDLPIIWITEQVEFIKASKRIGIEGFLVKPITDEMLINCVEHCKNIIQQRYTIIKQNTQSF